MSIPEVTQQQKIVLQLYSSFRFAHRIHIQHYLHHKSKQQTNKLLSNLVTKQYLAIYPNVTLSSFAKRNTPAVYCLDRFGIRYLAKTRGVLASELKNRYQDKKRTLGFVNKNLLLMTIYLQFRSESEEKQQRLTFTTKATFEEDTELKALHPDAYIVQFLTKSKHFLLEILDEYTPRYVLRRRIDFYLSKFERGDIESETDGVFPTILIICPHTQTEQYLLKYIKRRLIERELLGEVSFKLTTRAEVEESGVLSSIWETVE